MYLWFFFHRRVFVRFLNYHHHHHPSLISTFCIAYVLSHKLCLYSIEEEKNEIDWPFGGRSARASERILSSIYPRGGPH